MTIKLGLNIAVPGVLGNLNRSTDRVGDVLQRLSSGQRINRAGDDPAGLAVSQKLKAEVAIANQARRNVNDAISFLSVADGAMNAIKALEERKAELAAQSANGVFSDNQRGALQKEYTELDREIRRITATTEFNGIKLLEGRQSANAAETFGVTNARDAYYWQNISADGRYGLYLEQGTDTLTQIDFDTGEITVIASDVTSQVAQSATGDRVVFASTGNLTGEDPSGYGQVYVWDRSTGELNQITSSANTEGYQDPTLYALDMSADGSTIGFTSATRYNSDGSAASYAVSLTVTTVNLDTGLFTDSGLALTTSTPYLALSADGSQLAFASQNDLTGENADNSFEVFTFSVVEPTAITQASNGSAGATLQGLQVLNSGDVYFSIFDGGFRFSKYDAASDSTSTISESGFVVDRISTDNSMLYMRGSQDPLGQNPENLVQAFSYNTSSGEIEQVTNYSGTSALVGAGRTSADGRYVLHTSGLVLQRVEIGASDLNLQIETGSGEEGLISSDLSAVLTRLSGNSGLLITQQRNAQYALEVAKENIAALGAITGEIGSSLSRLGSAVNTIAELGAQKESARSRITDADIALEAAELIKAQILQQAATALLAQANQSSGLVLRLLGI